jgi:hypothetical protein
MNHEKHCMNLNCVVSVSQIVIDDGDDCLSVAFCRTMNVFGTEIVEWEFSEDGDDFQLRCLS